MPLLDRLLSFLGLQPGDKPINQIVYPLPDATKFSKYFNKSTLFSDVQWNSWNDVVDGFQTRFQGWYFEHLSAGHESYVMFCSLCALVEVFSYYTHPKDWHDPGNYKEFLRKLDSDFRTQLPKPIPITRNISGTWTPSNLKDYADVFYSGVRCSLHHHGDLAAFTGMSNTGQLAKLISDAIQSPCGTHSYAVVIFDPKVLKTRLVEWLQDYCDALKTSPSSAEATLFKRKFRDDFGVTIP